MKKLLLGRKGGRNFMLQAQAHEHRYEKPVATRPLPTFESVRVHLRERAGRKGVTKVFDQQLRQLRRCVEAAHSHGFTLWEAGTEQTMDPHNGYQEATLLAKYAPGDETYLCWVDISPYASLKVTLQVSSLPVYRYGAPTVVFLVTSSGRTGKLTVMNRMLDHIMTGGQRVEELPF